ncbi:MULTISPECIES: MFS transporter [unclassified Novosphingobium]|uniref:MFS transporter n=1 Tax=unclassified Novosphingobium TaxID=2644732 RepID=UPI001792E7E2|nr:MULTISPECIES: MFS transporter [unclassified Novosphingobium]MBB3357644.1 MHS family alpha-ketoglutarate permease-like MFS transporter [Novosphingobium sp. BK256]MBB3373692.1 MHS family alpha-ketoglutarate permease-like MFS transporter [Novosphingobium sp. BK280]MBB3378104.1 MHS family alpha-ketoglutarate permease-like MFS transporter [Novosphingobium sp. BK258]MBB3420111.1 MHS family alpha-ketoglutarate permease-like MFS transporter [Novosphingobium sp. BK267]MBB3447567.1 MHS family alpha-k
MASHADRGNAAAITDAQRLRAILAGSAGNLIEWYDFYIYAFTALYFSAEFFPESNALVQVMATSGIFAVGFLLRPIGGWYFGRFADRHGRQRAMVVSVLMMGLGALLIAALPTYRQVGIAAPALLLLGRMLQGFSTGGQYGTAATYLSEIAGRGRRGFWASFQYVTLIGGQLLATLVILALQHLLGEGAMKAYGWRIGFVIGAGGAALILWLSRHMHETGQAAQGRDGAGTLRELFAHHTRPFLLVMALTAGGSLSFYTFTTYMQKYLVLTVGMTKPDATLLMTVVLVAFMLIQPVMGALSDRIGRRSNIVLFAALAMLLTVPIFTALAASRSVWVAGLLVMAGLVINSFYTSVSGLFKAELFPVHVRALGVGLAYGVGNALFGGTAENVALGFKQIGHESGFYWYVTVLAAVALVAGLMLKDTRRDDPLA